MAADAYEPTARTTVRRLPERGTHDRGTVHAILDEAVVGHLGVVDDEGNPRVLPTMFARVGDAVYLHGSPASGIGRAAKNAAEACFEVTILDGYVLARSAFHHSMNYRSVAIRGPLAVVTDRAEQLAAMEALVEKVRPGRWAEARQPNEKEIRSTVIVRVDLTEVSAKVRTGGPKDDPEDMGLSVWAGVVPLSVVEGTPEPD